MASTLENVTSGQPAFQVLTKNEVREGNAEVSYVSYMELFVYNHVVRLAKNNVVTVSCTENSGLLGFVGRKGVVS